MLIEDSHIYKCYKWEKKKNITKEKTKGSFGKVLSKFVLVYTILPKFAFKKEVCLIEIGIYIYIYIC